MTPTAGLKLYLHGATPRDRRVRFAEIMVRRENGDEMRLVTDAAGRLQYRLPSGDYEIEVAGGGGAPCTIQREGCTSLRVRLP
jgi:hypothetical protein